MKAMFVLLFLFAMPGAVFGGDNLQSFIKLGRAIEDRQRYSPVPWVNVSAQALQETLDQIEESFRTHEYLLSFAPGETVDCFGVPKVGCYENGKIRIASGGWYGLDENQRYGLVALELFAWLGVENRYEKARLVAAAMIPRPLCSRPLAIQQGVLKDLQETNCENVDIYSVGGIQDLTIETQQDFTLTYDDLSNFGGLKRLTFTGAGELTVSPGAFHDLENLVGLSIDTRVKNISGEFFQGIRGSLKSFTIHIRSEPIPEDLLRGLSLSYLEVFDHTNRPLSENLLQGLQTLAYLKIGSNAQALPEKIFFGLHRLEGLHVGGRIKQIQPNTLQDLVKLKDLAIEGTRLRELPMNVFKGHFLLEHLSLANNRLASVSAAMFSDLRNLKKLNLSGNRITGLSGAVFNNLSSLEYLYLSGNRITEISQDAFHGLYSIREIEMARNRFAGLPSGLLQNLSYLERINLSRGVLQQLPESFFAGLANLRQVNLFQNAIRDVANNVFSQEEFNMWAAVNFGNNPLTPAAIELLRSQLGERLSLKDCDALGDRNCF